MPKKQVFISHVYEERHVALVLQKYIELAYDDSIDVFAAFDKKNIGGGRKWFTHITENLRRSDVVTVLLSHASRQRPWLNYEAGVGEGANALVLPVFIRGFSPGKLGFPLLGFQGRDIGDLTGILADITNKIGFVSKIPVLADYVGEVRRAEGRMAYKTIEVTPFLMGNEVQFRIRNTGNSDIELLMLEASLPRRYVYPDTSDPREVVRVFAHCELVERDGKEYVWFACTSHRGMFGGNSPSLRPVLTPAMGAVVEKGMHIRVVQPLGDWPIYYQVHAIDHPTEEQAMFGSVVADVLNQIQTAPPITEHSPSAVRPTSTQREFRRVFPSRVCGKPDAPAWISPDKRRSQK